MNTYAKLFSSIIHSTIWREPDHVRLVWVTMLAMSDRHGQVAASIPGLADAARVSTDLCRDALSRLSGPDPDSRSKEYDGRRIADMDGGWLVLNYAKHREAVDTEIVREQTRLRVARHRRKGRVIKTEDVTRNAQVTPGNAIRSEADQISTNSDAGNERPSVAIAPAPSWTREACDDWITRYQGTAPGGRIGKALKPLVVKHGWPEVRRSWQSYLLQTEHAYASAQRFADTYGGWSGTAAAPQSKEEKRQENNREVLRRFVERHES